MHVISICFLACLSSTVDDHWPGFLGAGASQVQAESLPQSWSDAENIAWQAPLSGYGQSSPVIWNDHIYVTSVEGEMKEKFHVIALRLSDGSQIWKYTLDNSDQMESSIYVSRAAPTPVVDANGVYVFYESGDMVALNHDGKPRWTRALSAEYGKYKSKFCLGASLAQTDDAVFVLADHEGPAYVLAINKDNGENIWKTERQSRVGWSSPAIVKSTDGRPVLVVSSEGSVDGYDPANGELLFSYEDVGGNTVCTPIDFGQGRFLIGASPGQQGQDGGRAGASNVLMRITSAGDKVAIEKVWTAERAMASFCSPVIHDGYAYWLNRTGVVLCFDAENGELKYQKRLAQPCWATPLCVGNRIYFVGQKGVTTVIQSGPEFKVLAENTLYTDEEPAEGGQGQGQFGGRTEYGVVAVNGSLLIRTGDILYCLRNSADAK
ncbi:MAG: PQQ-binding-like beta-propeller repeat protein [Pirellulales bacterium]|nr:PQQ-binding-like beta-propeller repeat protein [Pirellulales bacterium]